MRRRALGVGPGGRARARRAGRRARKGQKIVPTRLVPARLGPSRLVAARLVASRLVAPQSECEAPARRARASRSASPAASLAHTEARCVALRCARRPVPAAPFCALSSGGQFRSSSRSVGCARNCVCEFICRRAVIYWATRAAQPAPIGGLKNAPRLPIPLGCSGWAWPAAIYLAGGCRARIGRLGI